MMNKFTLLIDDYLLNLSEEKDEQYEKKYLLSYLNSFESEEWRYTHFNRFIFDNLCETALSAEEREKLPVDRQTDLAKAANNLRFSDDNGQGSELAEILLYGIMRRHYGALPVVPKIYYKQNSQDNAKGADSVHIVLEEDGGFTLWYGESKFYNDLERAMRAAITSVKDTITDEKLKKENSIVANTRDLEILIEDKKQLGEIKTMLSSNTSLDELKPILHIPILLLHECRVTAGQRQMSSEYKTAILSDYQKQAQKFFRKLNADCSEVFLYEKITFHLILIPVPNKSQVVQKFVDFARVLKDN